MGVSTVKERYIIMSKQIHNNKHLTLDERKIIQTGIENRSNKVDIARTIGKEKKLENIEFLSLEINLFIHPSVFIDKHVVVVKKGVLNMKKSNVIKEINLLVLVINALI